MTVRASIITCDVAVRFIFCLHTMPIDVIVQFTDNDYRVNERNMTGPVSFMPVLVSKNQRIANPLVLDVIPLTVMDASTRPPFLPINIPDENQFSPPNASKY